MICNAPTKRSGILVPHIRGDDESLRGDDAVKPGNDEKLAHICSSQAVIQRKNP